MLTRHFLSQSARQLDVEPKRISESALHGLATFDFPGNVRQLENICHWLTVMAPAQVIDEKDLPPEVLNLISSSMPVSSGQISGASASSVFNSVVGITNGHGNMGATPPDGLDSSSFSDLYGASSEVREKEQTLTNPPENAALAHEPKITTWEQGLQAEAMALLEAGREDVWDVLSRKFETRLILTALISTRGRRIEAAQKLGIGRNTITRKIQELNLE
jgi:two-component system nitrogen regulation response regulator GlnG